jgi:hypothetical protein
MNKENLDRQNGRLHEKLGVVVYTYNSSNRKQEDHQFNPAWGKLRRPPLENKIKTKGLGALAQVAECLPSPHKAQGLHPSTVYKHMHKDDNIRICAYNEIRNHS